MQLHLFPTVIKSAHLVANSPKKAFYDLSLVEDQGRYYVQKESGAGDKILDRRVWPMPDLRRAILKYNQILKEKLNPERNSKRHYQKVA